MSPVLNKILPMGTPPAAMAQEVARVRQGTGAAWNSAPVARQPAPSGGQQMNRPGLVVMDEAPSKAKLLDPHARVEVPRSLFEMADSDALPAFKDAHITLIAQSLATGALPNSKEMAAESPIDHHVVMTAIASMNGNELAALLNARIGIINSHIKVVVADAKAFGCELGDEHVLYFKAVQKGGSRPFAITDSGCMVHPGAAVALENI
jgi:hypothetical protein